MSMFAGAFLIAALLVTTAGGGVEPAKGRKPLSCTVGPIKRLYGKTQWLVYSCDDSQSVVVVTDAGSPASPFYFFFVFDGKGHELHGEGTGDKAATDAAFAELKALTESDIADLVRQTRASSSPPSTK
jgi:hypothetical protein